MWQRELIASFDIVKQGDGSEDPPGIPVLISKFLSWVWHFHSPKQRLQWSCFQEHGIDIVKICKICINLQNPIRLYENDGDDIYKRHATGEEWFILNPCNDVVQGPRSIEEDGADGQPPVVDGRIEEDEEAVPDAEYKLVIAVSQEIDICAERERERETRTHLDQNQLVQQDTLPHICECDTAHDDERPNHKTLRPRFENETICIRRLGDLRSFLSSRKSRALLHRQVYNRTHLYYHEV